MHPPLQLTVHSDYSLKLINFKAYITCNTSIMLIVGLQYSITLGEPSTLLNALRVINQDNIPS